MLCEFGRYTFMRDFVYNSYVCRHQNSIVGSQHNKSGTFDLTYRRDVSCMNGEKRKESCGIGAMKRETAYH